MKFGIPTLTRPCQVQPHASPLPSPRASLPRTPECAPPWTAAHAPHPGWLLQAWSRALPQDQPRPSSSRPALISVTRERPSVTMCSSGPPPSLTFMKRKEGLLCGDPTAGTPGRAWTGRPCSPVPPGLRQPSTNPGDRGPLWAALTTSPPHLSSLPDSRFYG